MRTVGRLLVLFLLLLAVGSGTAPAQPVKPRLQLCGSQGCVGIPSVRLFLFVNKALEYPATRPAPIGSYYILRLETARQTNSVFYVPAKTGAFFEALTPAPAWHFVPKPAAEPIFRLVPHVPAFKAPRIRAVVIGGKEAANAAAYADIFTSIAPVAAIAGTGVSIWIKADTPNPWFGSGHKIVFVPSKGLLSVDGLTLRPSSRLAAQFRKDLRGARRRGEDRSGLWLAIGIFIGVSVFLAGAERERRRQARPAPKAPPPPAERPWARVGTVAAGFIVGVGAIVGGVLWFEGAWSWVGVAGGGTLIVAAVVIWIGLARTALWIGLLSGATFLIELVHQASRHA